jgi:transposase
MRSLLVSAPQDVREKLLKKKSDDVALGCSKLKSLGDSPLLATLTFTLKSLAKRWHALAAELKQLDKNLEAMTMKYAVRLRRQFGFGPSTAAILMAVAGDNPEPAQRRVSSSCSWVWAIPFSVSRVYTPCC